MQQVARQLLAIRDIDGEIKELEAQLALLPGHRDVIARKLADARALIESSRQSLEQDELEERQLESKMTDQETLLAKLNDQTAQVTSSQAYEAIQTEIQHAHDAGSEFETRALELMESIDSGKAQLVSREEELATLEATSVADLEDCASREQALNTSRGKKLDEREVASRSCDPGLLARYDRLAKLKHSAAVVLDGNACPECRIVLPKQILSEIKRAQEIHPCSNCRRLLLPAHLLE